MLVKIQGLTASLTLIVLLDYDIVKRMKGQALRKPLHENQFLLWHSSFRGDTAVKRNNERAEYSQITARIPDALNGSPSCFFIFMLR